jgi:hypothetical protein
LSHVSHRGQRGVDGAQARGGDHQQIQLQRADDVG